jgi:signal transduction histidine kinase
VASASDAVEASGATVRIDPTDLEVDGHRATLLTMVTNLLVNAVTYVPEERDPEVHVSAERIDGGRIRIRVADNGIGIAVEHRERIFRIFERLHGLDRYPGTGIGLAAVAKGAYRMGGKAGVESEVGRGSTFWIELEPPE